MAATNGFFGHIEGPFAANEEIFTKIQEDCAYPIDYISKLGIHYVGDVDFDIMGETMPQHFVKINGINFQIGKTRMLQLEDVEIRSIKFLEDTDDKVYVDYQYEKVDE